MREKTQVNLPAGETVEKFQLGLISWYLRWSPGGLQPFRHGGGGVPAAAGGVVVTAGGVAVGEGGVEVVAVGREARREEGPESLG